METFNKIQALKNIQKKPGLTDKFYQEATDKNKKLLSSKLGKKMKSLLLFALILMVSCASGVQKLRKIQPGMSPAQVDLIMGERDGFKIADKDGSKFLLYSYINQLCNGHVSVREKCDFYVVFKDEKVVETGTKDVRSGSSGMQFLYVFQ